MRDFEQNNGRFSVSAHDCAYQSREAIKALVIDDEPLDVKMIFNLCNKSNHFKYSMLASASTNDATQRIMAHRFDIIFIDYWIGSETSMAFIDQCARALKIPFVLLTGFDAPDIRRLAFRAGVEAFLTKDEITTQAIESITMSLIRNRWAH